LTIKNIKSRKSTYSQERRNGSALRGHCPLALWKGGQRGHRCPYMPVS